jgi:hypothetical protein
MLSREPRAKEVVGDRKDENQVEIIRLLLENGEEGNGEEGNGEEGNGEEGNGEEGNGKKKNREEDGKKENGEENGEEENREKENGKEENGEEENGEKENGEKGDKEKGKKRWGEGEERWSCGRPRIRWLYSSMEVPECTDSCFCHLLRCPKSESHGHHLTSVRSESYITPHKVRLQDCTIRSGL